MEAHDSEFAVLAQAHRPSIVAATMSLNEKSQGGVPTSIHSTSEGELINNEPTQEELKTLRRVSGPLNWQAMTITFVEFCERFSWYGTTAVFVNFIQQPRPYGSRTGAINLTQACYDAVGAASCAQPGGLGQNQQASTGLTVCAIRESLRSEALTISQTFNQFWAYLMPLVGGYVADTYLGRFLVRDLLDIHLCQLLKTF